MKKHERLFKTGFVFLTKTKEEFLHKNEGEITITSKQKLNNKCSDGIRQKSWSKVLNKLYKHFP